MTSWVDDLAERAAAAHTAAEAIVTAKAEEARSTPAHLRELEESDPEEYQRQLDVHVRSPQWQARMRAIRVAVAVSRVHDAALLASARLVLQRRAAGRSAPRRLPRVELPDGPVTEQWIDAVHHRRRDAGIWRVIPQPGPELQLGSADDVLVQDVAKQARLLQASLLGHRKHDSVYEAYTPSGDRPLAGDAVPAIPGLGAQRSWRVNLLLGRGTGMRVRAGLREEQDRLVLDEHAVWERSRAYGDAVLALLRSLD